MKKPVAVTLEVIGAKPGEIGQEVIARFYTLAEAEDFLGTSATIDPDRLEAGHYGIDAPEELINPNGIDYCVDGYEFPDEESNLAGDGQFAPFRVFNINAQDYVGGTYTTREAAQVEADRLNAS